MVAAASVDVIAAAAAWLELVRGREQKKVAHLLTCGRSWLAGNAAAAAAVTHFSCCPVCSRFRV